MSFCLPRFLRRIQPSDLQGYFSARAIHFSEPIDWTAKAADLLNSVKTAIEALPETERERVFEDFERIGQVSDEIGQRSLRSLIEQDEALLRRFHSCNGSEARGLFVLLTEEEAFDNALATAYAEPMRHGRSWSGYCLPAPFAPSKSPSDIALFEADLSALRASDGIKNVEVTLLRLRNAAGRFGRLTIEVDGEHPDIYRTSAGWFGDFDPLRRPEWRVMQARLRIAFHPEGRWKRGKSITVELRAPNSSNLRDQTRRRISGLRRR